MSRSAFKPSIEGLFINRSNIAKNKCWLWTGSMSVYGYGKLIIRGKHHHAHRISWMIFYGEIPTGLHVLHKCDVTRCVNPDHLFLGTHLDNIRDMVNKKRHQWGEKHHNNKYTEEQIKLWRSLYDGKRGSVRKLANQFNVSYGCMKDILNGTSWKHLP